MEERRKTFFLETEFPAADILSSKRMRKLYFGGVFSFLLMYLRMQRKPAPNECQRLLKIF